ncbi:PAS domain-containing protein [bacterium]|nr:PAS domain-containing protein [bacterium]
MYRTLLENLPQKIFLKDKNSVYIYCNENYARDLKIKVSEIVGKTDHDFYSKKLAEKYRIDDKRIIKSGIAEDIEEEYLLDGRKVFVHTIKTPVRDDKGGNIVGILGIFWDISKQRKTRKQLDESEERYRLLFETSRDAIMTLAPPSWNFTSGNAATLELFGVKDEETFVSAPPWKYSPEFQPDGQSSISKAKKMINIAMEKGSNFFEWTHKKLNGEDFFSTVLLTRISIGEKTFLQATVRDITGRKRIEKELKKYRDHLEDMVDSRTAELEKEITERKLTEEELRNSKNKYKTLLENLPQKVFLLDSNLVFVSCNESFVRDKKIRREEIAGKTDYDFFPKELAEKYRADDERIIKSGKTEEIEDKRVINEKEFIEYTVKCPARDERDNIVGLLGISWDITERKRTEKMLKETAAKLQRQKSALEQKNIALSEIIAQIEVEKKKMKDNIAANVSELLFPILEKLELEKTAGKYVDLLKNHLGELVSSFGRKIRGKRLNLTPREIEICNMIKGKLTSKEISGLLNISYQTVEKHRKNIRRKMGIHKKDINLTSFLQTI